MMDKNEFNIEKVEILLQDCIKKIESIGKDTYNSLSLDNVINKYFHLLTDYTIVNCEQFKAIEKDIDTKLGVHLRILYHQALVYRLYLENIKNINEKKFPAGVLNYLKNDFSRIISIASKGEEMFLTFNEFQFYSYVQKLCFKCFPAGCNNLGIGGISRSLVFHQSFFKGILFAKTILQMGNNHPLFELHYNPHRFRSFNPKGWDEVFQLAAQMLLLRVDIKGVFGSSWFFDPALERVSPELSYIRKLIEKIGGEFFLVGASENDKKNALYASKIRKQAYKEGSYIPTCYIGIIKRDALLKYYM